MLSDERSQVSLLLILLSILGLSTMVHYARLSLGRMSRMPDEKSRSDLFNYRLMTVISLLVLAVSVVSIIAYNKSFCQ